MNANLCFNVLDLLVGLEIAAMLWLYQKHHGKTPKWVTKVLQSMTLVIPNLLGDDGLIPFVYKQVHIKTDFPEKTLARMLSDFRLRQYDIVFKRFKDRGIVCLSLSCTNGDDLRDLLEEITFAHVMITWYHTPFPLSEKYPMPSWY